MFCAKCFPKVGAGQGLVDYTLLLAFKALDCGAVCVATGKIKSVVWSRAQTDVKNAAVAAD